MASSGMSHNERATADPPLHRGAPSEISNRTAQEEGLFTCFPRLPPELRERIWSFYGNEPHVINLFEYGVAVILKFRYKGVPTFAGVNIESRRVALRRHRPLVKDTGMFIDLSTDIFNFYTDDACQGFLEFGLAVQDGGEDDTFQGQLITLEDVETKLKHVALTWRIPDQKWSWDGLLRFAGMKTLTIVFYKADGQKDEGMLSWEKDFKSAWAERYGKERKFPQILWESRVYIGSLTTDQRSWLTQSIEGTWSWNHGIHSPEARIKGWIPLKGGRRRRLLRLAGRRS